LSINDKLDAQVMAGAKIHTRDRFKALCIVTANVPCPEQMNRHATHLTNAVLCNPFHIGLKGAMVSQCTWLDGQHLHPFQRHITVGCTPDGSARAQVCDWHITAGHSPDGSAESCLFTSSGPRACQNKLPYMLSNPKSKNSTRRGELYV
jgi:hypothetical protein